MITLNISFNIKYEERIFVPNDMSTFFLLFK
jgi:hypothetical protein